MGYDNMHRITSKSQHLTQGNLRFDGTLNVGCDLTYTYGQEDGKKFQLDNVSDVNYRTEAPPDESQKTRNSHAYEYDAKETSFTSTPDARRKTERQTRKPMSAS